MQEKVDAWTHVFNSHPRKSYAQALRSPGVFRYPTRSNPHSNGLNVAVSADDSASRRNLRLEQSSDSINREGRTTIQNSGARPRGHEDPFYVRCLLSGHLRPNCTNSIKCHSCKHWGHIAKDCLFTQQPNVAHPAANYGPTPCRLPKSCDGLSHPLPFHDKLPLFPRVISISPQSAFLPLMALLPSLVILASR